MAGSSGCSVLLFVHTYVLYPLTLVVLDALVRRARTCASSAAARIAGGARRPGLKVTLVVAAHNEEGCIDEKLRTHCSWTGPGRTLEVLVGSDGSTDATDAKVESVMPDPRVRLSAAPRGEGGGAQPLHPAARRARWWCSPTPTP